MWCRKSTIKLQNMKGPNYEILVLEMCEALKTHSEHDLIYC